MHEYEEMDKLTEKQYAAVNWFPRAKDKGYSLGALFRDSFEFTLEFIAVLDLITDIQVLTQLCQTKHIFWTSVNILSVFSPYFASQIPYIIFLKQKTATDAQNCKTSWLGFTMVSPLMLVLMSLMDVTFLTLSVILIPFCFIIKFLTCGFVNLGFIAERLEETYEAMFKMQKLDAAGFRRMRTIT